jgi:hypothetical protein
MILPTRDALFEADRLISEGRLPLINDDENPPRRDNPAHVAMLSSSCFDDHHDTIS